MPYKDLVIRKQKDAEKYQRNKNNPEYMKKKHESGKKYYESHKEKVLIKNRKYMKNKDVIRKINLKRRIRALVMVDPNLKCIRCGCDDIRFLEINHINGGGYKEQKESKNKSVTLRVIYDGRTTEDLELLCRPCNIIHALEMKFGIVPLKVIFNKDSCQHKKTVEEV